MNTSTTSSELTAAHEQFDEWVRAVRDPATAASEGVRRIRVAGATAQYDVAPLPDGRWALRTDFEYRTGDCHGSGWPWQPFPTRDACIAAFVRRAKSHFERELAGGCTNDAQRRARREMLSQFDGLFGFIEPDPE